MAETSDSENQYFIAGLDLEGYQLRFSLSESEVSTCAASWTAWYAVIPASLAIAATSGGTPSGYMEHLAIKSRRRKAGAETYNRD